MIYLHVCFCLFIKNTIDSTTTKSRFNSHSWLIWKYTQFRSQWAVYSFFLLIITWKLDEKLRLTKVIVGPCSTLDLINKINHCTIYVSCIVQYVNENSYELFYTTHMHTIRCVLSRTNVVLILFRLAKVSIAQIPKYNSVFKILFRSVWWLGTRTQDNMWTIESLLSTKFSEFAVFLDAVSFLALNSCQNATKNPV